ncbi:bifunctional 4-hydroxy-2-oxoglutarate aldolase/2-dehydro-3-deoxy-phosphogluconate aldolase [Allosphingosinicella sp.]|jgi:2-dehydro-3-deoxyphosphogluconate aldolase/(4S)-4-hydroxy-2-oxoglutarate aldolase|uniref:bifunctional 4-hydroxy-2-oxoglutarate aldolase/2-dehydro-3-deoxy-phosphogluconate aldolase n=1 Tax=Allosphingosinicella sp. TaxID=2823234 RepID=UPI002EF3C9D2
MPDLDSIMTAAPVIPVLVIDRIEDAVPVAKALVAGGLPVLEITLRTPAALDAIRAMREVEGAIVGAGTVLDPDRFEQAIDAGAQFLVSPGLTERLAIAVSSARVPLLPGVSSASDVMRALDLGFDRLKFFPATAAGGIPALKALSSVFAQVRFCPTGGITPDNAPDWLALPSVACVGGTWLAPSGETVDAAAIELRARQASALGSRC